MVTVSTQAQIALRSLLPQDRERVERAIALIERFPHDEQVRQSARQLGPYAGGGSYLIRVTPELRLIFKLSESGAEVLDVVTHERLERMYGYAH